MKKKSVLKDFNDWLVQELATCLQQKGNHIFSKLEFITWQVTLKQIHCGNFIPMALALSNILNDYGMTLIIALSAQDAEHLVAAKLQLKEAFQPAEIGLAINTHDASLLGEYPDLPIRQVRFSCHQVDQPEKTDQTQNLQNYRHQMVIDLAQATEIEFIASHMTDERQIDIVRKMGCEYGQGPCLFEQTPLAALDKLFLAPPLKASTGSAVQR